MIMKLFTRLISVGALLGFAVSANAVPSKARPFTFTQPDGTTLTVTLVGDERAHCYFTTDGVMLLNQANTLYYATLDAAGKVVASDIEAKESSQRSSQAIGLLSTIDQKALAQAMSVQAEASDRGPRGNNREPNRALANTSQSNSSSDD